MKPKRTFDRVIDSMAVLAGLQLVSAVFIVCLEICMRYFFNRPQIWTVEVCEYLLFGIAFFGAPWLLREGGHVNVDIVVGNLGPRSQAYLKMASNTIGVFVCMILCWFSLVTALDNYQSGVVVVKTLSIPKHYFLIIIAFGYLMLSLQFARQLFGNFTSLKETP
ncbi:TRAP transporter small permease [bacterium]|nr:TRAP transporter small permease [bacterium]